MQAATPCDTSGMWMDVFCCPLCHGDLSVLGTAGANDTSLQCMQCNVAYPGIAGSFDFAVARGERVQEQQFYQKAYRSRLSDFNTEFDPTLLARRWEDPYSPEGKLILKRMGDLDDRLVLCLGNGASTKELHFLSLGAKVIISDLSMSGVLAARSEYSLGTRADRAAFHAMDAYHIPLKDASVDVVYGYEFVHHLADLHTFFREVSRVLKPGGLCVFFDNAYSPIYQSAKRTLLWPLMRLSHFLYKRSPEDIRATYAGGYRETSLMGIATQHGFSDAFFDRLMFFQYLAQRGVGCLFGWDLPKGLYRSASATGRWLDRFLTDHSALLQKSRITMVWGFHR